MILNYFFSKVFLKLLKLSFFLPALVSPTISAVFWNLLPVGKSEVCFLLSKGNLLMF